jgi:hypothetical protein
MLAWHVAAVLVTAALLREGEAQVFARARSSAQRIGRALTGDAVLLAPLPAFAGAPVCSTQPTARRTAARGPLRRRGPPVR